MQLRHLRLTTALLLVSLCVSACGGTPAEKEARYLKKGNELFEHKEYKKAKIEYLNAARLVPTDPEAMYRLGMVDDAVGDFREAYGSFMSAEQQNRHFHPAMLKLAEYYLASDQFIPANDRINAVIAEDPKNAQARALLATRYFREKQYSDAEIQARDALKTDPNNILAIGVLSGVYKAQNNVDGALDVLKDGLSHNPKDETLLRLQAATFEQKGDLKQAAQSYQLLFDVAPDDIRSRLRLVDDYIKANDLDQAEATLRAGIAAQPDDWDLRHQLVLFLADHRDLPTAEKEIRQYMKDQPDQSGPLNWLIDLYIAHDMANQTDALLDGIIAQNTNDQPWIHAMTAKARIQYLKQNNTGALQLVDTVLAKDPNNLDAQFVKAHIEADQGNYAEASLDLRNIIRDKPLASEAYDLLAELLLKQGHKDLAIDTLNQLADLTQLKAAQQVRLAQLYALNGDPKHAMDLLVTATKVDPDYPVGWETTARIALDQKDFTTAGSAIETLDGLKDQHLTALLLRGEEALLQNKMPEALAAYTTVINTNPASAQAEHAMPILVNIYQAQGQLPTAASFLETLQPATSVINTLLGQCYLALGDMTKAANAFDKAIASHPRSQDPYVGRAQVYMRDSKLNEAINILAEAATADPADMRAPIAEAQLLEKLGRIQPAIDLYTTLLTLHPESDLLANNMAEIIADHAYNDSPKLEQARQIAERFTASANPTLLDTLAWVYFRQGRTQDALMLQERASRMTADMPAQFHYHYGMTLLSANHTDQAIEELRKATVKDADYPGLDDAQQTLAKLAPTP